MLFVAALDFVRPAITGPLANIIPNIPASPLLPVVGAVVFAGSAIVRRRLLRKLVAPPGNDPERLPRAVRPES
jgi:hypothetical protein